MIAVSDLTDSTKPLEYDYPWLEDTVEPYTSNFDMLGICVCVPGFLISAYGAPNGAESYPVALCYDKIWATLAQL